MLDRNELEYETFDDEWGKKPELTERPDEATIIQCLRVGNDYNITLGVLEGEKLSQSRRVQIIQSYHPEEGGLVFNRQLPKEQHAQDLPKRSLKDPHDITDEVRTSLTNVRKKTGGASVRHQQLANQGDPNYRIPKPASSFSLRETPANIAETSKKHILSQSSRKCKRRMR